MTGDLVLVPLPVLSHKTFKKEMAPTDLLNEAKNLGGTSKKKHSGDRHQ
jgi:hypothetical protein